MRRPIQSRSTVLYFRSEVQDSMRITKGGVTQKFGLLYRARVPDIMGFQMMIIGQGLRTLGGRYCKI
jgi:hypothetical protein